jgi:hypothetical protein
MFITSFKRFCSYPRFSIYNHIIIGGDGTDDLKKELLKCKLSYQFACVIKLLNTFITGIVYVDMPVESDAISSVPLNCPSPLPIEPHFVMNFPVLSNFRMI